MSGGSMRAESNSIMRAQGLLVFVIMLLCFNGALSTSPWEITIHVSPSGSLLASCGSVGNPCKTLDFGMQKALEQASQNHTRIVLKQGSYSLQRNYVFTLVKSFEITGEENAVVVVTCSPKVSLAFVLSENIGLYNLKFLQCGGWQKSLIGHKKSTGEMLHMEYMTALYFSYCNNVQMRNIEVTGSDGVGVTLTDVSGITNITDSIFQENLPRRDNASSWTSAEGSEAHAGGGVFLILNSYGYNPVNISRKEHAKYQHNGKYFFSNVDFIRNQAKSPDLDDKLNSPLTPFSRGGGLGIYLFGNASGNAFTLSRCRFVGNRAQWGGGLQIEFKHETEDNTVEVSASDFKENFAAFAGGGARLGDITISKTALKPNRFRFKKCIFQNNTSTWGGGASLYGTTFLERGGSSEGTRHKFEFSNSVWFGNNGNIGSALGVFLFNLNADNVGPLVPLKIVFNNCNISNNDVITRKYDVLIGQGAVYSIGVPIIFKGYLRILNNTHTSLVLDSANLLIDGQTDFYYNTGYRGGALALYGNSKVRFAKKSKLLFIGNKCVEKGGAIYIYAPGSPQVSFNATGYATHSCFFEYIDRFLDFDLWETEIVFQGNVGPNEQSGLSVYVTSLQNCRRVGETRKNNSVLQWKTIKFFDRSGTNLSDVNKEVSTDPVDVVFRAEDWHVAPSEIFNASITLVDEIGNPVYGIVNIDIRSRRSSSRVRLATPSSLFLVHQKQVPLLSLSGKGGDVFDVVLSSEGRYYLTEEINNLTLRHCNPGFHSNGDKCVCSEPKFRGISRCANDGQTVFLKRGFWAGTIRGQFHTVPCPVNYCKCSNPLGENANGECTYQQDKMCDGNRDDRSILCGMCKPGYTASFGSEACVLNCSSARIAYFLLIAVILIAVVMGLMTINLDVFTGYLNAWLYSYQVISLVTPETFEFDDFMEFIIGVANLKVRVAQTGSCFTQGLDEADKLAIMYILPSFVLFIVLVVAQLAKWFPNWRYNKYVKSPFSAFSTIFVLCYTNVTGISLKILNPIYIAGKTRVFTQGELEMFKGKHLAYGLLAIGFIGIIVIPIPLLLIFQPWIAKCLRRLKINVQRLKPLFDKLQGCFKDEYRWCAAFYFLSRIVLLLLDTYVPRSPLKRALLEAGCVVILIVFVWLRPYKEGSPGQTDYSWINISDAVLLTNLTFIAVFSSAIEESPTTRSGQLTIFVKILAYVPLLVLAVVLYRAANQYYHVHNREDQTKCEFIFKRRKVQRDRPETEAPSTSDAIETTAYTLNRRSEPE